MATSGNIDKSLASWLTMRINWVVNSQNAANNTSNVTVKVQLITGNGSISSTASKAIKVSINGTTYSSTTTVGISKNTTKTLYTKTVDVPHNSDGTKKLALNCTLTFDATISGSWWDDKYVSGTATLNTIARTSTVSISGSGKMGEAHTIKISRKSSSFTHTLKYTFGGSTTTIVSNTTSTSYSWTPAITMAQKIPNATSGTCKITCETYNGSTQVGSSSASFTLDVPTSVKPTISAFSLTEAVSGLASKFTYLVDKKSKINFSVTAAGAQGSTIKSYDIYIANQHFSTASGTTKEINLGLTEANDLNGKYFYPIVTVTDSRGRTAALEKTLFAYPYIAPTITNFTVKRCNSAGTLDDNGTRFLMNFTAKVASVNSKNSGLLSIGYKKTTDTAYSAFVTNHEFSREFKAEDIMLNAIAFSVDNSYHVKVTVGDYFTSVSSVFEVSTAKPMLDLRKTKDGVGIGKVADTPKLLDIGYETRFYGGIRQRVLENSTDFDTLLTPNIYTLKNAGGAGYVNCPFAAYTGTLKVESCGNEGQIRQVASTCSKDNPLEWERYYYQSAWGAWRRRFGVTLFNNADGVAGTLNLSENVLAETSIFKYIEIFFEDNVGRIGGYAKILPPFSDDICLSIIEAGANNLTYIRRTMYNIKETNLGVAQLTPNTSKSGYVLIKTDTSTNVTTVEHKNGGTNFISIRRIVGYE